MHSPSHPHAVRLIGFAPADCAGLGAVLLQSPAAGPHFYCLLEDSLQEPDLYVVKADDAAALTVLAGLNPGDITPALLLGPATPALPFVSIDWPPEPVRLHRVLAELVARRAQALARMAARGLAPVLIERRRNPRLDIDLSQGAAGEHEHASRMPPLPSTSPMPSEASVPRDPGVVGTSAVMPIEPAQAPKTGARSLSDIFQRSRSRQGQ